MRRMSPAGTPQTPAAHSGVDLATCSLKSWYAVFTLAPATVYSPSSAGSTPGAPTALALPEAGSHTCSLPSTRRKLPSSFTRYGELLYLTR
ncbi:MAG TPA: hypothetical protein DD417_05500 [Elusimicrobia bacterium]|nr:hypothetical protein [Elusimicrobiota bacterium]